MIKKKCPCAASFQHWARRLILLFVFGVLCLRNVAAQTACGVTHRSTGVFICYPNPAENPTDSNPGELFHFSAQANPRAGELIRSYVILIDNRVVYESRLPGPLHEVSIETNLTSPFSSGSHRLQLVVYGVGSAEVSGLRFQRSSDESICNSFSRSDPRVCDPLRFAVPLRWGVARSDVESKAGNPAPSNNEFGFPATLQVYSRNLKRIEADNADAIATDSRGNLYTVSHVMADVELRKYSPAGGIVYDSLIRSCGSGFLQLSAIAVTDFGLAAIAGNTTACFRTTAGVYHAADIQPGRMRGVVMLVDTTKSSGMPPTYLTYLADGDYRVTAIRLDQRGSAYLIGTSADSAFPHDSIIEVEPRKATLRSFTSSFVAVLNGSGSALQWSTMIPGVRLNALSIDGSGAVYATGNTISENGSAVHRGDAVVIKVSSPGRQVEYMARFRGSAGAEGRAISAQTVGDWVLVSGRVGSDRGFVAGIQACQTGAFRSVVLSDSRIVADAPVSALGPALDALANSGPIRFPDIPESAAAQDIRVSVDTAPPCREPKSRATVN